MSEIKTTFDIFQDWNPSNSQKGKLIMLLFRIAKLSQINILVKVLLFPYLVIYKFFIEWILGIELPYQTTIGSGLNLFHGQALVVHRNAVIGRNCTLRHSTTIGNINPDGKCPVIGNDVEIGTHCCILGPIIIGNNVIVGAGSIVVNNIPSNSVAVGNPARVIKSLHPLNP